MSNDSKTMFLPCSVCNEPVDLATVEDASHYDITQGVSHRACIDFEDDL